MAVVIVDDSVTNLVVLKHLSAAANYKDVKTFSDPRAAIAHLAENASELVIVDCVMPHLDGISFVSALRGIAQHAHTPVVMVTQLSEQDVRKRAMAAGVTNFLNKPVNLKEFKTVVKAALGEAAAPEAQLLRA